MTGPSRSATAPVAVAAPVVEPALPADGPAPRRAGPAGALRVRPAFRLLAAVAAVAVVGVAAAAHPRAAAATPTAVPGRAVPVAGDTAVCPAPDGGASTVTAATSTPGAGLALVGGTTVLRPGERTGAVQTLPRRAGATVVRAGDVLSGGFVATLRTLAAGGTGRSLALAACTRPRPESWLVGPGADAGGNPVLELAEPDGVPAAADVTVFTPDGPQTAAAGPVVDVPAHGTVQLPLAALAPEAPVTAVRVVVTRGRVAAALLDRRRAAVNARGADWVPLAGQPAAQVTVAGLPSGADQRDLVVVAPGADAVVRVEVLAGDRRYVPVGLERVAVPGGTVASLPLGAAGRGPAALRVTATGGKILAAVRIDIGGRTLKTPGDLAWLGPAMPLSGAAALPAGGAGLVRQLLLTAPGLAGSVTVGTERVDVPAGRTVRADVRGGDAAVTPRSGGGQILAVLLLSGPGSDDQGPLLTAFVPVGDRRPLPVPAVLADPSAALP